MATFISYSRANSEFAIRFARDLKSVGFDVWLDQLDIPKGSRWDDEIEKALDSSTTFLIVLSPESIESQNVKDEVGYAIDSGKNILPVLLKPCKVPFRLRRFQFVDFSVKPYEDGLLEIKDLLSNTKQLATQIDGEAYTQKETATSYKSSMAAEKPSLDPEVKIEQAPNPAKSKIPKEELKQPVFQKTEAIPTQAEKKTAQEDDLVISKAIPSFKLKPAIIIIAVIGFVGILCATLISSPYVAKLFSSGPPKTPTHIFTPESPVKTSTPIATPFGGGGAIVYYVKSGDSTNIYKFDVDTQHEVQLTNENQPGYKFWFSWSPDNRQIVFQLEFHPPDTAIMIMNSDGSNLRAILKNDCRNWFPDWSPDGEKILFSSDCPNPNHNIYTMSIDGSSTVLVADIVGSAPKWSPDGKFIAFQSNKDGNFDIYTMKADGTNINKLTSNANDEMAPIWSPNGKQIAFSSSSKDGKGQIYIMDVDGSNQLNLSNNLFGEAPSSWSPDGTQIVFESNRSGENRLYTLDINSGFVLQLPVKTGASSASWSH